MVKDFPGRAGDHLAAVKRFPRLFDVPERDGDLTTLGRLAKLPDRVVLLRDGHLAVGFILPAKAVKALQNGFPKQYEVRLSAAPLDVAQHGSFIFFDFPIDDRRGRQRDFHFTTPFFAYAFYAYLYIYILKY